MKILIFGGYGNAGIMITKLLLQYTSEKLIVSGRNLTKAESVSKQLNSEFNTNRVSAQKIDASDKINMETAFKDVNIVIVASSTIEYSKNVIDAALKARIDYFDLQLSSDIKLNYVRMKKDEISAKGLCFITDGGFHPGLPAAMVRYSAKEFDEIYSAKVYSYINIDWENYQFSPSTGREMIDEFNDYDPRIFFEGEWKKLKWSEYKKFDFGNSIGKQYVAPMMIEEMKNLPEEFPSLKTTGFFVGGFNWFVNYISIPFTMVALKISKTLFSSLAAKLFEFGLKKFSESPFICMLKLEAIGIKDNKKQMIQLEISHSDGYFLTAAPVAACLLQYLDGSFRKPGLHFQANTVKTEKFFNDLLMMGIDITIKRK